MIDHDQLFKKLISTFFTEFIELFLPQVAEYLERDSITFLEKEFFTDIPTGDRRQLDLLAKVNYRGQDTCFLIHIEHQSSSETDFAQRMFRYFSYIPPKHGLPVYPIVVFSFDSPQRAEPKRYRIDFPDRKILDFNFVSIQLNRLNWRTFLQQHNPIAAALMSKMKIQPSDRPKVKAECLRLLVSFRLDPARMELVSGFVDTYLRLNVQEDQVFQTELDKKGLVEQEEVMQIITSWMEQGIEQGIEQGEGARKQALNMVQLQLSSLIGDISQPSQGRIETLSQLKLNKLGLALLRFSSEIDLVNWLDQNTGN